MNAVLFPVHFAAGRQSVAGLIRFLETAGTAMVNTPASKQSRRSTRPAQNDGQKRGKHE